MDDALSDKAGTLVADSASIRLRGGIRRFVSRGGEKLEGALEDLRLDVRDWNCLDIGASTGGFTDCLLQNGARQVVALDVGRGQLHSRLRNDSRVTVHEGINARELQPSLLTEPIQLIVADVSFISLRLLLPAFLLSCPTAQWLLLVKPQFEIGRALVGKGGVVRDDALRAEAVDQVVLAAREIGYLSVASQDSRLAGPKGNREIFVHFVRAEPEPPD